MVVDLPRRIDDGVAEVLAQLDVGLLVVPAELRAVAAAGRVASAVGMVLRDLRVVVRGPYAPGLDDHEVARLLGLPLAGEVPVESGPGAPARAARRRRERPRAGPLGPVLHGVLGAGAGRGGWRVNGVRWDEGPGAPAGLLDGVRQWLAESGGRADTRARGAGPAGAGAGARGRRGARRAAERLRSELVGTGPLEPLLADPSVTDVLVAAPDRVWVDRGGGLELTAVSFPDAARRTTARAAAGRGGRTAAGRRPALGRRPAARRDPAARGAAAGGRRLHLPVAAGGAAARVHPGRAGGRRARCRRAATRVLRALLDARLSFLISGGTG